MRLPSIVALGRQQTCGISRVADTAHATIGSFFFFYIENIRVRVENIALFSKRL